MTMSRKDNFKGKDGTNGFDKRPGDAAKYGGRKPSIKTQLQKVLDSDGTFTIKAKRVIEVKKNGDVVIEVPKAEMIALKLTDWVINGKGSESIRAINMMIEHLEGKAKQEHVIEIENNEVDISKMSPELLGQIASFITSQSK